MKRGEIRSRRGVSHGADARLARRAPWRRRTASPKQLQLLLKMKGIKGEVESEAAGPTIVVGGKSVVARMLTAGQVSGVQWGRREIYEWRLSWGIGENREERGGRGE